MSSLLTVVLARVQELPLARCGLVTVLPSAAIPSVSSAATIWEIGLSGSHPNTFNLRKKWFAIRVPQFLHQYIMRAATCNILQ